MDDAIRQAVATLIGRKKVTQQVKEVEIPIQRHLYGLVQSKIKDMLIDIGFDGVDILPFPMVTMTEAEIIAQRLTGPIVSWLIDRQNENWEDRLEGMHESNGNHAKNEGMDG